MSKHWERGRSPNPESNDIGERLGRIKTQRRTVLRDPTTMIAGYLTVRKYSAAEDKWYTLADHKPNLLTTDGRDFFIQQCYINTSAGTRGANYIAVSTDSGAPAAGDTTLTGEISTNGLQRADADQKNHSDNSNAVSIIHEYTASGSHTNVQKCALFNDPSAGIMTHEGTFTPASLISGDKLQVTYSFTMG